MPCCAGRPDSPEPTEVDTGAAAMVDLAFALRGSELPRDHRLLLARALAEALPWLVDEPQAAVLPIKLVTGTACEPALLSARARLLVRAPRERVGELEALAGRTVRVGGCELGLLEPQVRELLPHTTLYAHFVDAGDTDEAGFLDDVDAQLERLGVPCHRVCGREQRVQGPTQALHGYSLMLHGLRAKDSLRVLEHGLGEHRLMGCGVFVPHKSAAAVGD
jgi:CRISPR-associated protein Cas6